MEACADSDGAGDGSVPLLKLPRFSSRCPRCACSQGTENWTRGHWASCVSEARPKTRHERPPAVCHQEQAIPGKSRGFCIDRKQVRDRLDGGGWEADTRNPSGVMEMSLL